MVAAAWKFKTPVFLVETLKVIFAVVSGTDLIGFPFYF
jgi:hypothetical protein